MDIIRILNEKNLLSFKILNNIISIDAEIFQGLIPDKINETNVDLICNKVIEYMHVNDKE